MPPRVGFPQTTSWSVDQVGASVLLSPPMSRMSAPARHSSSPPATAAEQVTHGEHGEGSRRQSAGMQWHVLSGWGGGGVRGGGSGGGLSAVLWRPPSLKESGVAFTTAIRSVRSPQPTTASACPSSPAPSCCSSGITRRRAASSSAPAAVWPRPPRGYHHAPGITVSAVSQRHGPQTTRPLQSGSWF